MTINVVQAALRGLCACLSSMPGLGGTVFGNYTLGRPLIGGLVVGLILGNVPMGIMLGAAIQIVYIALVTPGGTVSADVRAISYIGIPLAMLYVSMALTPPARKPPASPSPWPPPSAPWVPSSSTAPPPSTWCGSTWAWPGSSRAS